MIDSLNYSQVNEQRALYMAHTLSHDEFYLWLAEFIGATRADVPFSDETLKGSQDEHFNDIPLHLWDLQDGNLRSKAYRKGIPWSMCETVCTLKALAKKAVR